MAESRHDDQQDEQSENQASKDIEGVAILLCISDTKIYF